MCCSRARRRCRPCTPHSRGPQFPATWPEDIPPGITELLGKALARDPAARYPSASALWHALNDLEAQAQAAREAEQRAALAAQWRAEAERALAENNVAAAKMALGRWRAVSPDDPGLREAQGELERIMAPPPAPIQPTPTVEKSAVQDQVLADLLEQTCPRIQAAPVVPAKPAPIFRDEQQPEPAPPASGGIGSKIAAGIGALVVLMLVVVLFLNSRNHPGNTGIAPTAAIAAPAATAAPVATAAPASTLAMPALPTTPATETPPIVGHPGGTLKMLYWQAVTILNPHQASGTKDSDAARLILEPLASWDETGKAVSTLASNIPTIENGGVSQDLKTITWKLKSGIKWSDGSRLHRRRRGLHLAVLRRPGDCLHHHLATSTRSRRSRRSTPRRSRSPGKRRTPNPYHLLRRRER